MRKPTKILAEGVDFPVREAIEEAEALFKIWGPELRNDSRSRALLERLGQDLDASRETMLALEVVKTCRRCEQDEGGSCCGLGIENRYTSHLLLINLLLDVSLPTQRFSLDSCYFLHADGCCLKARHVLCVNYLCARLKESLSPEGLSELQSIVGKELDTGFVLYEAIKKIIG